LGVLPFYGAGISVDGAGSVYVAGCTGSASGFPLANGYQSTLRGARDAFFARLAPGATGVLYATFLGGDGTDAAWGIRHDGEGNAVVVGVTDSSSFPTTAGAVQPAYGGGLSDCFLAKINPGAATGLLSLVYSTYVGGTDADFAHSVFVDATGACFVGGMTRSADFPAVTPLPPGLRGPLGGGDALIVRFAELANSPVVLTGVRAWRHKKEVWVSWGAAAGSHTAAIRVERAPAPGGPFVPVGGLLPTSAGRFRDHHAPRGEVWYRVIALDAKGAVIQSERVRCAAAR
ncbi:MAG: hypothetical protein QHJ73_18025, partial [Armatimonadota bacterium]|nr:hypothetical protein [Armatimonadota bacterium]